jgi:hypothetical protein
MSESILLIGVQILLSFFLGYLISVVIFIKEIFILRKWLFKFDLPLYARLKGLPAQIIAFIILIPAVFFIYILYIQDLINVFTCLVGLVGGIWFAFYLRKRGLP